MHKKNAMLSELDFHRKYSAMRPLVYIPQYKLYNSTFCNHKECPNQSLMLRSHANLCFALEGLIRNGFGARVPLFKRISSTHRNVSETRYTTKTNALQNRTIRNLPLCQRFQNRLPQDEVYIDVGIATPRMLFNLLSQKLRLVQCNRFGKERRNWQTPLV